ncbi:MAG: hypothetical protein LLG16_06425 [Euryarchaeota archaeon]|nr:hypothetical protein [Euryarchaeota archaeon]
MIEFFLSKFWAIICALVLLGAVTTSIDGLGDASEHRSRDAAFSSFVEEIDGFLRLEGASKLTIPVAGVVNSDEERIDFRNGSVWLIGSNVNKAASMNEGIVVLGEDGTPIDDGIVTVHMDGFVVLTKGIGAGTCFLEVQDANVSATFLTESTKMSQSLSSL